MESVTVPFLAVSYTYPRREMDEDNGCILNGTLMEVSFVSINLLKMPENTTLCFGNKMLTAVL